MKLIPYSRQSINFKDINVVKKVLKSSIITTGKEVEKFEKKNKLLFKMQTFYGL